MPPRCARLCSLLACALAPFAGLGGAPLPTAEEVLFRQKAQVLLGRIADAYAPTASKTTFATASLTDPQKDTWPKVVARFAQYGPLDPAGQPINGASKALISGNAWLDLARAQPTENVFHFAFPGAVRILALFPDSPGAAAYRRPHLLNVFARQDNYNAFTGEGTENHIGMGRTSAYLYAELALAENAAAGEVLFPTAEARRAELKAWVLDWSRRVYHYGNGEWNSSVYDIYNLTGWLNLHDFAEDPEVRAAARAVLDFYAASLALHYSAGQIGGAESRGNTNYANLNAGTATLAWLWFAADSAAHASIAGTPTRDSTQTVHAATSGYRPPFEAVLLARKAAGGYTGHSTAVTRSNYLLTRKNEVRGEFFSGPGYTLGSADLPYGGFTGASSALVQWKLVQTGGAGVPAHAWGRDGSWANNHGRGRSPYTQVLQHRNVLFQLTFVPANAATLASAVETIVTGPWRTSWNADFNARWPVQDRGAWGSGNGNTPIGYSAPNTASDRGLRSYLFFNPTDAATAADAAVRYVDLGAGTYLAVRAVQGTLPTVTGASGSYARLHDQGTAGALFGLVVEVGNATEHGTFANFQSLVAARTALDKAEAAGGKAVTYTALDGRVLRAQFQTAGSWSEQEFDWSYGVATQRVIVNDPAWRQPEWPAGEGHGRVGALTVNGAPHPAPLLPGADAPLFDGPALRLANGVLEIGPAASPHRVDFVGPAPVFQAADNLARWQGWLFDARDAAVRTARLLADSNRDGRPNLLDWVLGRAPDEAAAGAELPVRQGTYAEGGQTYATVAFTAHRPDARVEVAVEFSASPADFSAASAGVLLEELGATPGPTAYLFRDTVPLSAGGARFGRVRVTFVP